MSHFCSSTDEVDRILAKAREAGYTEGRAPKWAEWGGYSGYVVDPDGHHWELAYYDFSKHTEEAASTDSALSGNAPA